MPDSVQGSDTGRNKGRCLLRASYVLGITPSSGFILFNPYNVRFTGEKLGVW